MGKWKNGTTKYKTVTNKFATLVVYALTDKGSRSKLTTIVLGPTDSAKLTVAQDAMRSLEAELPGIVTTTDIGAITGIETANPLTVTTPPVQGVPPVPAPVTAPMETPASPVGVPAPSSSNLGKNATTLTEWYQAQGQALPSVGVRAQTYQGLGLGQSSFYTGTAEQNTKLLNALKK